jgi:hypothetical protein
MVRDQQQQRDFARNAIDLSLPPPFLGSFHRNERFADATPSIIELAKVCMGFRQI